MRTKKSPAQLDREIATALGRRSTRRHAVINASDADKERVVELLKQGGDSREVARDLLLQRGIIKTGRVSRFDKIGDSFSGPIYQINIGNRRYWMIYDPNTFKIPGIGAVLDFSVTDEPPPLTIGWPSKSPLKQQLHPAGILRAKGLPESVLRRWVEKWWIE
jgi:hypothetical protein